MSYDADDLTTETAAGRLNVVRFLSGDNDATNEALVDAEWNFLLDQNADDVYLAAAAGLEREASSLEDAATEAKQVGDLRLEYDLQSKASDRRKRASDLRKQAKIKPGYLVKSNSTDDNAFGDGFTIGMHDWA